MELCILKFDGSRAAGDALHEVTDAQADRNPWLHEIGVVARPLLGRVRISATFPDGKSQTFHEGDLAEAVADRGAYTGYFISALAGPLAAMSGSLRGESAAGAIGSEAEQRLFHLDEVKKALPRDSSALALIADEKTCDTMVDLFQSYEPKVIRRDVADELRQRLQDVHQSLVQRISQSQAAGAPATH